MSSTTNLKTENESLPLSRRSSTIPEWSSDAAIINGVLCSESTISTWVPLCKSVSTTSHWPSRAASAKAFIHCEHMPKTVVSKWYQSMVTVVKVVITFTLADDTWAPRSINRITVDLWPLDDARVRAVSPDRLSCPSTVTSATSSRYSTTSSTPHPDAWTRACWEASAWSTSALGSVTVHSQPDRNATTLKRPFFAASTSGHLLHGRIKKSLGQWKRKASDFLQWFWVK